MEVKKHSKFQRYVMPGLIFQSVVIAGGYGTGAELNEYFFRYGPLGGLLAMCIVTFLFWAIVSAVTFEFARIYKTFDYRSLMKGVLGKAWFLYEICYLVIMLIVMAVVAAAAGVQLNALLGCGKWLGTLILALGVVYLVVKGTGAIEKFLSMWSYVLYAVYGLFLIITFAKFGGQIGAALTAADSIHGSWALGGAEYAFYNLACVPLALFATRDAENTKEAVGSGLLCGLIGILPAILLYLAMCAFYPEVTSAEAPVNVVFDHLNMPWLRGPVHRCPVRHPDRDRLRFRQGHHRPRGRHHGRQGQRDAQMAGARDHHRVRAAGRGHFQLRPDGSDRQGLRHCDLGCVRPVCHPHPDHRRVQDCQGQAGRESPAITAITISSLYSAKPAWLSGHAGFVR